MKTLLSIVLLFALQAGAQDSTSYLQQIMSSGNEVTIAPGTYILSKPLFKSGGTLTLHAEGVNIILAPSFPKSTRGYSGAFRFSYMTWLTIEGLTINGNRAKLINAGNDWRNFIIGFFINDCSNVNLTNCTVNNGPSNSFSFNRCSNVNITNCTSTNGMYHGLEVNHSSYVTVDHFHYKGPGNMGRNDQRGGIGMLASISSYISFLDCLVTDGPDTGTKTEGCSHVVWDRDTVSNCGKDGIKFMHHFGDQYDAAVPVVYDCKITNCVINKINNWRNDGSTLVQIWNGQDVQVSNNIITGGFKKGYEAGIQAWTEGAGPAKNIFITNNKIYNCSKSIYLSYVDSTVVDNNYCENETQPLSPGGFGFIAESSHNLIVSNNTFIRSGTSLKDGAGIKLWNCGDLVFSYNTVKRSYGGLEAALTTSKRIDISHNTWDSVGYSFAYIYANGDQSIDSLNLNDNTVSNIDVGWSLFTVRSYKFNIGYLDVSNTKMIGNGANKNAGFVISTGGTINELNLTNFSTDGNITYPKVLNIKSTKKITGLL